MARCPSPQVLKRSTAEQTTARHRRPGADVRRSCSRRSATSASRRRSSATVAGPHITRYELRLAPGDEDVARSPSSRTTSPTRWPRPTSASSPRSPASRPSASRSPTQHRRIVRLGDVYQDAAQGLVAAHRLARQGRRPARRSAPTWRRCRTCSSPARPAPASRAASTRCSARSCCARRPTRSGWCSSTPSRSSSTTTRPSRTC